MPYFPKIQNVMKSRHFTHFRYVYGTTHKYIYTHTHTRARTHAETETDIGLIWKIKTNFKKEYIYRAPLAVFYGTYREVHVHDWN